jgi:hypothetical protein
MDVSYYYYYYYYAIIIIITANINIFFQEPITYFHIFMLKFVA